MSCIQNLLILKGKNEQFRINSGAIIDGGGIYNGHDYLITFNHLGFRCGYVAIKKPKKFVDKDIGAEDFFSNLEVHGGVTFAGAPHRIVANNQLIVSEYGYIWIGFDAGHCYDKPQIDKAMQIFPDSKKYLEIRNAFSFPDEEVRTFEYMEQQCKQLIDQIVNMQNANKRIKE